eukprot:gb/GFBE01024781.1/.p1 GENE.gb/GFBE01024781.1/~~gb/GFBE01024781.1/.p1  ORF type:complete len:310 (+),score=88.38 gb/GFBE01024781.1/:1-930(+)
MKRSADSQLIAEGRPPQPTPSFSSISSAASNSNPFAGVSLIGGSSPSSSSSLFTSAASSAASSGTGFALGTSPAAVPTPAAPASANPFMGLSLFSSPPAAASSFASVSEASKDGTTAAPTNAFAATSAASKAEEAVGAADATAEASQEAEPEEQAAEDEAEDEVTGEEDEEVVFRAECKLWKLVKVAVPPQDASAAAEGNEGWRWQERGCGVVHLNRHKKTGAGRLVMRMRGVLKLLLNTPVFPTTKYEKVGQKSVRFVGVDAEMEEAKLDKGEVSLSAFRLNLFSGDQQGKFLKVLKEAVGAASSAGA